MAEFCKMGQKVSHIIAEMPSVAQPRYSMFCFMLSAFPRACALGSAGPGDAVTLCPCP